MKHYDAIIIGAGIGGLAAGVLLAHAGKKVAILEKNALNGGRLTSWEKDGFHLDLGVHVISRGEKGPVMECLRRCGIEPELRFNTVRPNTSYQGEVFKFPRDVAKYVPQEDFDALMRFMADVTQISDEESHAYDNVSLQAFLDRYTKNQFVHNAVNAICVVYIVVYEDTASAGEFIRCLNWESAARSSGYPEGGCVAIPNAYIKAFQGFGGELYNNTPVEKILVKNDAACGVVVNGETWTADMIVSNSDIKTTVFGLTGGEHFPKAYLDKVSALTYSECNIIMRIALKQKVTDIKMFSTVSETSKIEFKRKLQQGVFDKSAATVFLVVPSNFSEGICPPDQQLLMCASSVPYGISRDLQDQIFDYTLNYLDNMFPGMKENILWVDKTYYQDLEDFAGENGNCIGIGQVVGQCGADRPRIQTPVKNLYIVGGDAGGGGVGIENAINSAMEFFDTYAT